MAYHDDLLDQAEALLHKDRRKPKQASLRRAVSTAYYSLYHLLVDEASTLVISGTRLKELRFRVARAFDHGEMRKTSRQFASGYGGLPRHVKTIIPLAIPYDLQCVAQTFTSLQEARHEADYDLSKAFTRKDAADLCDLTREAFSAWSRVRKTSEAQVYLTSLLLGGKWDR